MILSGRGHTTNNAIKSKLLYRLAALILPALLLAQPAHKPESRKLLVICIAGLDARFLAEPPSRVKIPNLRRLARSSFLTGGVVGVAPSDTTPSELSLLTGVPPSQQAVSLPDAAAKDGLRVAAVYWPNTGHARLAFNFPQIPQQARDVAFDAVAQKSSPAGVIDAIEKASPGFQKELWDDSSSASAAIWLLQNRKADVVLVHLSDIDSEQRETGALGLYSRQALDNDDEMIGRILAAVPPGMVVALVSGHGFENENYVVRPNVLLKGSHVKVEDGLIGTTDRAVADRLRQYTKDGHKHGIAREVPMAEVKLRAPALGNWVAAFDTPQNYLATAEDHGSALGAGTHKGISGLWPTRPGYRSVFLISGQGIFDRKTGEIDLLQIAPTLASVIGVKLPQAKAASLWPSIQH
jgi:predicted AlkP superfamily pyrophosphatase or phosphodiesterase